MSTTKMESFHIIGLSVKTTNENGQSAKDIPVLWNQFMSKQIASKIPNKLEDSIYCLYTNYEEDHMAPYTTLLGCKVNSLADIPEGMKGMTFSSGNYQKFNTKGDLTQGLVYNEWLKIWNLELSRAYSVDFEVYDERAQNPTDAEVDIFVAVK